MKNNILRFLCCPNCRQDLILDKVIQGTSEEVVDGVLQCKDCNSSYRIVEGIPVLLPQKFSNAAEVALRDSVSGKFRKKLDGWELLYDKSHFRSLAHLRIKEQLSNLRTITQPNILDIGIGWGVNYLPFASKVNLFGLDFSLESLLLLKFIQ